MGAFTFAIDPKLKLTVVTISGAIDMRITEELVDAIRGDPHFDAENKLLVDAKRISWQASMAEFEGMVEVSGRVKDSFCGGNALVVSNPVYEDLGDLFKTYASMNGVDWSVFNDFDKAHAYLFDSNRQAPSEESDS